MPTPDHADDIADLLVRVYEIHACIIAETGGIVGLREAAMLHAAVSRPFVTYEAQELYPDDFEKAAALFHSLIKSHPFMDGTKRTAFAAALFFLQRCGYILPEQFPLAEVVDYCVALAEENLRHARGEVVAPRTISEIAAWFEQLLGVNESAKG